MRNSGKSYQNEVQLLVNRSLSAVIKVAIVQLKSKLPQKSTHMRTNVENTLTFIFPYLFNEFFKSILFFSYPEHHLLVSRNRHRTSQFSKRNVCLSFTAFEERRGFNHSRVRFDDIVFSLAIIDSNSGSKRFRNMVYKYRNVGQLVALESKLIRAPRKRRI